MSAALGRRRVLALALAAVGAIVVLGLAHPVRAAPASLAIRGVTITNVSDTGFSVNWVTDQTLPGSGSVDYGTSATSLVFQMAESPVSGARGDVHSVNVRSLSPGTQYFFSVVDAGVTDPASGYIYTTTTGPTLQNVPTNRAATGQVFQSDGRTPAVGVLVTVRVLDNANLNGPSPTTSAPLSTFTNPQGSWTITLSSRTVDNAAVFNFATSGPDFLLVTAEGGGLGVAYPAQSSPIRLDGSGNMTASPLTLGAGVNPATTPVVAGSSPTATASPTQTPVTNPVASPTPSRTAQPTPRAGSASSAATPTRTPVVIPTVAVPTQVELPSPATPSPPNPTPMLPSPPPSATVAPSPTRGEALPSAGLPAPTPPPPGGVGAVRPVGRQTPSRATLTPTATFVATTSVTAGGPTGNGDAPSPLQSLPLVLAGGLGLIGLGLAISVVGFVDQRRDG